MRNLLCLIAVGLLFLGCETLPSKADGGEVRIAPDAIPANVVAAAQKAVPGLRITGAEKETEKGVVVYDVNGTAGGVAYEVEVAEDGTVGEIEEGDDAEDDDGEDDDDSDD